TLNGDRNRLPSLSRARNSSIENSLLPRARTVMSSSVALSALAGFSCRPSGFSVGGALLSSGPWSSTDGLVKQPAIAADIRSRRSKRGEGSPRGHPRRGRAAPGTGHSPPTPKRPPRWPRTQTGPASRFRFLPRRLQHRDALGGLVGRVTVDEYHACPAL